MYPTTPEFATALAAEARRWASRVEVLSAGQVQASLDVVLSGRVNVDDVAVRRSAKVGMVDPEGALTPTDARSLLAPVGTELRLWRGLRVGAGIEWVPLGVFGITEPEISDNGGGTQISLTAHDRVDAVRKRRFAAPWRIVGGTPTHTAITDIVTSRLEVPVRITDTGHTVPESMFDELSDPWDAVRKLARADGLSAYFDPLGTLVVAPEEEIVTDVVYEPGDGSLVLDVARWMSDEDTYSGVIVIGEHPDETPVRYEMWDTDPASPTFADGPFGRRPFGFSSPLVNSVAKAQAAAETIFARVTKMRQRAELTIIGHPGHDIGDTVTVRSASTRTNGSYVVVGATIPLRSSEPMRLALMEAQGGG